MRGPRVAGIEPSEKVRAICPYCGKEYSQRGIDTHIRKSSDEKHNTKDKYPEEGKEIKYRRFYQCARCEKEASKYELYPVLSLPSYPSILFVCAECLRKKYQPGRKRGLKKREFPLYSVVKLLSKIIKRREDWRELEALLKKHRVKKIKKLMEAFDTIIEEAEK